MKLLNKRAGFSDAVIQDKFIRLQLQEESAALETEINSLMSRRGFKSSDWYSGRSLSVEGNNTMLLKHLPKHRFVDMKTRNTKTGKKKKKSHPIHNKPVYGVLNNIIKRLHFGFTKAVKEQLMIEV